MEDLLTLLNENARAPIAELAQALNVTEAEVISEIARLEREGVIRGYRVLTDPAKTHGDKVTALIEVKITPERGGGFDRLASRIAKFEQVKSCYLMSGGYDLLVVVEGANLQEISLFISEKLSTIRGVLSTATRFRLKSYKENGTLLIQDTQPERLSVSP
jgi:DNA-binding Lrp family transcriptional regulator